MQHLGRFICHTLTDIFQAAQVSPTRFLTLTTQWLEYEVHTGA